MIVVDANVVLAWVLPAPDEHHEYSARLAQLAMSGTDTLVAPRIITAECAHVLLRKVVRQKWSGVLVTEYAEVIETIPVRLYRMLMPISTHLRLSLQYGMEDGNDTSYLTLALALGVKLATLDKDLRSQATLAGVELFE